MSPALSDLTAIQLWRKLFLGAGLFALLAWTLPIKAQPELEHSAEHAGLIAIMICIIGRAWCSLYIGGGKSSKL